MSGGGIYAEKRRRAHTQRTGTPSYHSRKRVSRRQVMTTQTAPQTRSPNPNDISGWRTAWTKFTFLAFCWFSYFLYCAAGIFLYYLILPRAQVVAFLNYGIVGFIAAFLLILGAGLLLITATSLTGIDLLYPHNKPSITVKLIFPVAATLSQLLRIDRNKLRTSFVKLNNALTRAQRKRIHGDRLLVLLPHCLQIDACNRKITHDIGNCQKCGKCPVALLLETAQRNNLNLQVVNGGTLARRKVKTFRPDGIVAVACERDLTFGIQDVYPIPVYGVINDRPNGPCVNTCVDMRLVEEAIRFFKPLEEKAAASSHLPEQRRAPATQLR
ncbi:MAG: DUF116 domain-containing protein [Chitinivibrionales bacterium]|nr:DUF116 domain-containing protein [Chitinivibrionales bacterium]